MSDAGAGLPESIAVIGMRGRFPGADNVEQLWQRLCNGEECIVTLTEEELGQSGVDAATMRLPGFVPRGGVLSDIEMFDAQFFGFSPRDAEVIDPQQRLFMECAYECLESAGYNPDAYPGLIGVYAGSEQSTYAYQLYAHGAKYLNAPMASIGNDKDYLTTLTSYKLNLRGPSIAVQTACSTSLVAVGLAAQSLLNYQCDMALAGGVCVQVPHRKGYFYEPGGIVSPDGHCRTFDAAGQGTVVGSGVGLVLLKRLSEALAEGDEIHAVIKGAALNNDGAMKIGFGAPSVEGQAQVITMAQAMAGVDPETIEYIEAHGTATLLGDPIEMAALNQVFTAATRKRHYCAIGSLKSNVGHLASAAGVAGLIKAVLALKHDQIPPSLHFTKPNPQINFASSPFFVNTRLREWKRRDGQPRRAGVSSFGVGGTNAHVVVEEAPRREPAGPSRPYQLLLLSAKTPSALEAATDNLAAHLDRNPELDLANVAYTLQVGRKEFPHRRAVVGPHRSVLNAAAVLRERNWQHVQTAEAETRDRPVVFLFSGQGSQYVNMGLHLYEGEPTFRAQIDLCADRLKPHLGLDLRDVIYPPDELADQMTAMLTRTSLAQPALFSLEYSLAKLWMEWGIVPQAMAGHSIGEYVAACLAGVFTLEEALSAVAYRGYLMDGMPEGAMLAVPLAEKDLLPLLGTDLALAAVNGAGLCAASGPLEAIEILENRLSGRGIEGRRLHTSHAFHSHMMEPVVAPFVQAIKAISLKPPQIRYFSNLTGTWATPELVTDPDYYGHHLRHTVRFFDHLQELAGVRESVYLEVGPGQTLCTLARQAAQKASDQLILPSIRPVHEQHHDGEFILKAVARLWLSGVPLNWTGFSAHERRRRVPLPTYPFERKRYWVDAPTMPVAMFASAAQQQQRDVSQWFYVPSWKPSVRSFSSETSADSGSRWLVFSQADSLGESLRLRLIQNAADVVTVLPGERFENVGLGIYTVAPGERQHYDALIAELKSKGRLPDHVAHLWNSGPVPGPGQELELFESSQQTGFYSLICLAQAFDAQRITQGIQIGVVTRGLHSVVGGESLFAPRGTVVGAARALPQEYPNLRCRVIDLGDDSEQSAEQIIAELTQESFAASVAYRNGRRWVQSYEPLRIDSAVPEQIPLRQQGVYLITGGLGKLGLTLAEHLAREWKARVVLTARSTFPTREEWDGWIASRGETDPTSRKIRRVLAMEEAGGEVLICSADSADREQMARVLEELRFRFGALHGVIHGAGATSADSFGPASEMDATYGDKQFRPKVHGLHVLEDLLAGQTLDLWVLLSSLSAVLGGLNLVAYASANAYLDAVGTQRNQQGSVPWIVTNWDAWLFPEDLAAGAAHDPNAITPAAGVDAFRRILSAGTRHVVISTTDLQERLEKWVNLTSIQESSSKTADAGLHSRPTLSTEYAAPRTEVEKTVADVWQEILGVAPIGVHDKFFELGGHSLLAVQLIAQLREAFQVELSAQRLFEAPTIGQLAETIELELKKVQAEEEQREQERLAELLDMVANLTDEQVREMLARESTSTGGQAAYGGSR